MPGRRPYFKVTVPGIYLSLLISSGLGLLFHLIRGGSLGRLVLYLAAAWITFLAGHFVAEWLDWNFFRVGSINLFAAVLAAVIGLLAAALLAGPERSRRGRGRHRRKS
ncbi:MAG: hypothetical protein IH858_01195 [Chloroflexi bacterium]|nr:hypothetical protein [Chloroflexota bacterium]